MATGKVVQPKALLKLPKELPSNIVISSTTNINLFYIVNH
jgi:hypothetical protein